MRAATSSVSPWLTVLVLLLAGVALTWCTASCAP